MQIPVKRHINFDETGFVFLSVQLTMSVLSLYRLGRKCGCAILSTIRQGYFSTLIAKKK